MQSNVVKILTEAAAKLKAPAMPWATHARSHGTILHVSQLQPGALVRAVSVDGEELAFAKEERELS